jgi:hypothetical protein
MDMTGRKFTRQVEDFVCEHCGALVVGNGYTNHCPECFWSKHVDVHPGDREAPCLGLMAPVGIEQESGHYLVMQRCTVCQHERRNRVGGEDSMIALARLAQVLAERQNK